MGQGFNNDSLARNLPLHCDLVWFGSDLCENYFIIHGTSPTADVSIFCFIVCIVVNQGCSCLLYNMFYDSCFTWITHVKKLNNHRIAR